MSIDLKTKVKWFERGATAFRETFPGYETNPPDTLARYACPLCATPLSDGQKYRVRLFSRSGLENGNLTAEHVPQEKFGGDELVLTCKACNNEAGYRLEGDARRRENPIDVLSGRATGPARVQVSAGEHFVHAELTRSEDWLDLRVPPLKTHANNPAEITEFEKALAASFANQAPINGNFVGDAYHEQRANVAWLKQGYLVLFALFGYRYIFSKGLAIVRQQIQEPDVEHIPLFLTSLSDQRPWSERHVICVNESNVGRFWVAQMGRYIVMLPLAGDDSLYSRLAEEKVLEKKQTEIVGEPIEWPREPSFGLSPGSFGSE